MSVKLPHVKKPCKDCPFRKDTLKGWLGKGRMTEITGQPSFVCHKETKLQCAGHMLLKEYGNEFYRTAAMLRIDLPLKGRELVFDSVEDCIEHHS